MCKAYLCPVTEKPRHGTTLTNAVFKGVDKLLLGLHTIDIGNKSLGTDKNLGTSFSSINSRSVGKDGISSYGFVATLHVKSRVRRLVVFLENRTE